MFNWVQLGNLVCICWGYLGYTGTLSLKNIHNCDLVIFLILRMAIVAPWYVKNTTIHRDIKLPFVKGTLRKTYSRHHSTLTVHPNPLIRQIPLNMPLAIQHRRLKRKRHTDILTQGRLLEDNHLPLKRHMIFIFLLYY